MTEYDMFTTAKFDNGLLGLLNELFVAIKEVFVTLFSLLLFIFDNFICLLIMCFGLMYWINSTTNIFIMGFRTTFGL